MFFKIIIYIIFSLLFLFTGIFASNLIIDKDPMSKRFFGSAKIIYNIDYGFYALDVLEFKVSQIFNVSSNYYSNDTKLLTYSSFTKDEVDEKFNLFRKQIIELDLSLKKILEQKYNHTKQLIDQYNNENDKLSNSIQNKLQIMDRFIDEIEKENLLDPQEKNELLKEKITIVGKKIDTETKFGSAQLDILFGQSLLNQDLDIYMENLKNKNFEHNFVTLSNVEYFDEHLNINYNSRVIITLLFTLLGIFVAWCILEIRSFFSRRNSL